MVIKLIYHYFFLIVFVYLCIYHLRFYLKHQPHEGGLYIYIIRHGMSLWKRSTLRGFCGSPEQLQRLRPSRTRHSDCRLLRKEIGGMEEQQKSVKNKEKGWIKAVSLVSIKLFQVCIFWHNFENMPVNQWKSTSGCSKCFVCLQYVCVYMIATW